MSSQKSESKTKIDPFLLFSIGRKRDGENVGKILVPESDEEQDDGENEVAKKLSFSSSAEDSKQSLGEDLSHQKAGENSGFLQQSECEEKNDSLSFNENERGNKLSQKGLETLLVEEAEDSIPDLNCSDDGEVPNNSPSPIFKEKKTYRRIVTFQSDDSDSDEEKKIYRLPQEDLNDASFDLGAIKKRYTPKPIPKKKIEENDDSTNDYDLEDSFINDDEEASASDEDTIFSDFSEPERSDETSDDDESEKENEPIATPKVKLPYRKVEYTSTPGSAFKKVMTATFLQSLDHAEPQATTHPLAKRFLVNFKKNKVELAQLLYKMYNEAAFDNCLPSDMPLKWSNTLTKTAGRCLSKFKPGELSGKERHCEIELASKVLTSTDRIRDTLIHEM